MRKKRIVISGAGEVGRHAAEVLVNEGHSVTVIDLVQEKLQTIEETIDITSLKGSSCQAHTLTAANVSGCDVLIAATNSDEANLLTAALGKKMGASVVVARIHDRDYFDNKDFSYSEHFGIDHLICPEQLTSLAITANLSDPGVIEIEHFAQNQIEMHRYRVTLESKVVGPTLRELSLPIGMRFAVVERDLKAFIPTADTTLEIGDIVTLVGKTEQFKEVKILFARPAKRNNQVAVMGGTTLAEWLVEELNRHDFHIRWFERDRARALELSEEYGFATVIASDPTDPDQFRAEDLAKVSAFITVTDDDEHNILGALQAKQFGVPQTVAVIHKPTFLHLLANVGIDLPFSPRIVAARELLKIIDDSPVKSIATLAPKVAEVYEVGPVAQGSAVGKILQDIELPKGMFVAARQRGQDVIIPRAEDEIAQGDILVLIGAPDLAKRLSRLFMWS